jgi:hypothetical protein
MAIANAQDVRSAVDRAMARAKITDIHTHLYAPCFGDMLAWGVDELLTYHYLIAEFFRNSDMPYEAFWKLSKKEQADAIWKALFVDASPMSEATRGVVTVLHALGSTSGSATSGSTASSSRRRSATTTSTSSSRRRGSRTA